MRTIKYSLSLAFKVLIELTKELYVYYRLVCVVYNCTRDIHCYYYYVYLII
jgi:hypothetical protein